MKDVANGRGPQPDPRIGWRRASSPGRRRHPAEANAHPAGFTLLELLIALTLLGLLMLILLGGLRFSVQAWHRSQTRSDQITTLHSAGAAIERLLAQAQPAYAAQDPTDPTIDFAGSADAVTLVAPLPDAIDPGILARQHLGLAPTATGLALVLTWRLDLPGPDAAPPPATTAILLDDVRSLRLRYWGAVQPNTAETWQDRWQGLSRLPKLISVEIQRGDDTRLAFMVAPQVTSSPACRYYPIGPMCQRPR